MSSLSGGRDLAVFEGLFSAFSLQVLDIVFFAVLCKKARLNWSIQKIGRILLNIHSFLLYTSRIITVVIKDNIGGAPAGQVKH